MVGFIFGIIFLLAGIGLGVFFFVHKHTSYEEDSYGNYKRDGNGNRIQKTTQPFKKFAVLAIRLWSGVTSERSTPKILAAVMACTS